MVSTRQVIVGGLLIGLAVLLGSALHAYGQTHKKKTQKRGEKTSIVYDRVHAIPAGGYLQMPLHVPTGGYQFGGFLTRDASADVNAPIKKWLGLDPALNPDIEILIMDEYAFAAFTRYQPYSALYSSGRRRSGSFNVHLPPGQYRVMTNNRHSLLTPKNVVFTLYKLKPLGAQ